MKPGIRQHGPATLRLSYSTAIPAHMRGGILEITDVQTPDQHRRQGYASLLVQKVCAEADEAGKVLMLMPRPFNEGGMGQTELVDWYARLGFETIQVKPLLMARRAGVQLKAKVKPLIAAMM